MNFRELFKKSKEHFAPAVFFDGFISSRGRKIDAKIFDGLLFVSLLMVVGALFIDNYPALFEKFPQIFYLSENINTWIGLFGIFLSIRITFLLFEFFYRSFRNKEFENPSIPVSFSAASVILNTDESDLVGGFLNSIWGRRIILRLNISEQKISQFLSSRKRPVSGSLVIFPFDKKIDLGEYLGVVFDIDQEFQHFLFENKITKKDFCGAAFWLESADLSFRAKERWWSKESLSLIKSLGRDWAYGETYLLQLHGLEVLGQEDASKEWRYKNEVSELEGILSRKRQANALLVGEGNQNLREALLIFASKITEGKILPALEGKIIFLIDAPSLISGFSEKATFENELKKMMNQAVHAGNIIVAFEDFPTAMDLAYKMGSNILELLLPYFVSSSVQIIAIGRESESHKLLENNPIVRENFEIVRLRKNNEDTVLSLLSERIFSLEARYGVFFAYPAVLEIVHSAKRYFAESEIFDKAFDLSEEVAVWAGKNKRPVISKEEVEFLITQKTGVPVAEASGEEKNKLLNLEKILHERIVGQQKAIDSISKAIRRVRSGIVNENRPIGSFLFLGPTGVGKTETAKALANVFFNSEDALIRFDMSEYQGGGAIFKLIGSNETGEPGVLVSKLRERPYGVLLLDEFEKTTSEVHDLFLQILDEGVFSDKDGIKVSAYNTVIIATSNAASDLIWDYFNKGEDVSLKERAIIDVVIERGIFKPELINRFDGVVVFHPLSKDEAKNVALLMLKNFAKGLFERGIELVINDDLLNEVVSAGYDKYFGARPMRRAIQDKIEALISKRILEGKIKAGDRVELKKEDFLS